MSKMIAVFEIEFDTEFMCDAKTLKEQYDNEWFWCIQNLYEENGLGIFIDEPRLVEVKEKS